MYYLYVCVCEREREKKTESKGGREEVIDLFKELANKIVEAGKSKIIRVGQRPRQELMLQLKS